MRLFSRFLEEYGIQVSGKDFDGKITIELYQEKPDSVLVDIMMANSSEFYAIKKIRNINSNAKIITVTGDSRSTPGKKLDSQEIPIIHKLVNMAAVSRIQD